MSDAAPQPPPVPVEQQSLFDGLSHISMSPLTLRRTFVMLTRAHWSDPENYGPFRAKMERFVWSSDPKQQNLFIDFDYNYDPTKLDRRPAIFVGTSDFDFIKIVVDDHKKTLEDRSGQESAMGCACTIIVRHIGKTAEDSWAMGELSAAFFLGIRQMMQERAKFRSYEVIKLLASRPFEKASQQADKEFMVDLVIGVQFTAAWNTIRESHRIKTIAFKAAQEDFSVRSSVEQ